MLTVNDLAVLISEAVRSDFEFLLCFLQSNEYLRYMLWISQIILLGNISPLKAFELNRVKSILTQPYHDSNIQR